MAVLESKTLTPDSAPSAGEPNCLISPSATTPASRRFASRQSRRLFAYLSVITCIDRGFDYEATIMTINGGYLRRADCPRMTMFAIVGGVYRERCVEPLWDAIYGSAGRALAATTQIAPGARLVSYVDSATATGAQALADDCGATFEGHPTPDSVCFDYLHPLAAPRINPQPGTVTNEPITVSGDVVLRYGMLEGDAVVHAKKAGDLYGLNHREVSEILGSALGVTVRVMIDAAKVSAAYRNPETLILRDAGAILSVAGMLAEWLDLLACPLGFMGGAFLNVIGLPSERFIGAGGFQLSAKQA